MRTVQAGLVGTCIAGFGLQDVERRDSLQAIHVICTTGGLGPLVRMISILIRGQACGCVGLRHQIAGWLSDESCPNMSPPFLKQYQEVLQTSIAVV